MKAEDVVRGVRFTEVLPQENAAGKICAGDAVTGISKSEQVMRIIAMCADVRQTVGRARVRRRPSVFGANTGDIWIERRQLVHQLPGALNQNFVALSIWNWIGIGSVH